MKNFGRLRLVMKKVYSVIYYLDMKRGRRSET